MAYASELRENRDMHILYMVYRVYVMLYITHKRVMYVPIKQIRRFFKELIRICI